MKTIIKMLISTKYLTESAIVWKQLQSPSRSNDFWWNDHFPNNHSGNNALAFIKKYFICKHILCPTKTVSVLINANDNIVDKQFMEISKQNLKLSTKKKSMDGEFDVLVYLFFFMVLLHGNITNMHFLFNVYRRFLAELILYFECNEKDTNFGIVIWDTDHVSTCCNTNDF